VPRDIETKTISSLAGRRKKNTTTHLECQRLIGRSWMRQRERRFGSTCSSRESKGELPIRNDSQWIRGHDCCLCAVAVTAKCGSAQSNAMLMEETR
jgi:hypothetical protein